MKGSPLSDSYRTCGFRSGNVRRVTESLGVHSFKPHERRRFTTSARSRIEDADFAAESARLAKAQVLQQTGTAMLAQANAQPQLALSLIR